MGIAENLQKIHQTIEIAKKKSPHPNEPITLVAVSKNHAVEELEEVLSCGQMILGENRVQELLDKHAMMEKKIHWHLIGHLQQNKVKYIVDKVEMIHSLESLALAEEISKRMKQIDSEMRCLVQVNVAEEESKYGLPVEEVVPFIEKVRQMEGIRIVGLMNIAPNYEDKELVRPQFRQMYELFCQIKAMNMEHVSMEYLSMGMSGDYEIAIEEGSNMVRIGSAIFK